MVLSNLPSWRVAIIVKHDPVVTVGHEAHVEQVIYEEGPVDKFHGVTEPAGRPTQVLLHAAQGNGRRVDSVHHEAQLGVLHVLKG